MHAEGECIVVTIREGRGRIDRAGQITAQEHDAVAVELQRLERAEDRVLAGERVSGLGLDPRTLHDEVRDLQVQPLAEALGVRAREPVELQVGVRRRIAVGAEPLGQLGELREIGPGGLRALTGELPGLVQPRQERVQK